MTIDETRQLIKLMAVTYPNYKPENLEDTAEAWFLVVNDIAFEDMKEALRTYIRTNTTGFAPVPAQLIEIVYDKHTDHPTADEAWLMVKKAISDGYYHSVEQFNALPEIVRRAVVSPDNLRNWSCMDSETINSVTASNFRKSYMDNVLRSRKETVTPSVYRPKIAGKVEVKLIESPIEEKEKLKPEDIEKLIESILPGWMKR